MINEANGSAAKQHLETTKGLLVEIQSGVDGILNSNDGEVLSQYVTNCLKWIEGSMERVSAELVACHEPEGGNNANMVRQHLETAEDLLGRVQSGVDVMLNSSDGDILSAGVVDCLTRIEESMAKVNAELVAFYKWLCGKAA